MFQVLGLVVSVATVVPAAAQELRPPELTVSLSIAPLDTAPWRARTLPGPDAPLFRSERVVQPLLSLTSRERWDRFESEFGIRETPATPVRFALANGVYHLNVALFALASFAQDVGSVLNWRHNADGWQRTDWVQPPASAPKTLFGRLNECRFRIDCGTVQDKPFAVVKWEIPFGS